MAVDDLKISKKTSFLRSTLSNFLFEFSFFFTFRVTKTFRSEVKNKISMSIYLFDHFICF